MTTDYQPTCEMKGCSRDAVADDGIGVMYCSYHI